jgi:hypothetical protein
MDGDPDPSPNVAAVPETLLLQRAVARVRFASEADCSAAFAHLGGKNSTDAVGRLQKEQVPPLGVTVRTYTVVDAGEHTFGEQEAQGRVATSPTALESRATFFPVPGDFCMKGVLMGVKSTALAAPPLPFGPGSVSSAPIQQQRKDALAIVAFAKADRCANLACISRLPRYCCSMRII